MQWENPTHIRIYINPGMDEPLIESFNSARIKWTNLTDGHISFLRVYTQPSRGIRATSVWREDFTDGIMNPISSYNKLGVTYFDFVEVAINRNSQYINNWLVMESVASHELGHALGLDHRDLNRIMHSSTEYRRLNNIIEPQTGDILGVNRLYNGQITSLKNK